MLSENEYNELVDALLEDGFTLQRAKQIIDQSLSEGLLDPPTPFIWEEQGQN